ncbi:MAG: DNA repair protein RadA [Phycisphaerales bacterium]
MAKSRQVFVCRSCGSAQSRWLGKCPDCGTWDALEAQRVEAAAKTDPQRGIVEAWATLSEGGTAGGGVAGMGGGAVPIGEVPASETTPRIGTGLPELDRVLGGPTGAMGLVPGSAVLVGGPPGIGKSTLLLQAAAAVARRGTRVLYVSSEESAAQVRARAERLGAVASGPGATELFLLADTNLARIVEQARKVAPAVLVIDSVQMVYKPDLPAAPGSITQLRRCCADLAYLAKMSGIAVVLVGHVTKDDQLAGPRLLEHLVDAVLRFEGDRHHAHRIVRAAKNRFGATQEIGLFEMTAGGLRDLPGGVAAAALGGGAGGAGGKPRPGSVVCPVFTGSRCLMVELQALTATGFVGAAKRKCSGIDANRMAMLIAVLEQHAELRLADRDVFASAVGGMRVVDPGADLALLLAIGGAQLRRGLAPATAVVGEVGLGGEIRPVAGLEQRVAEAARLGYRRVIVPKQRSERLGAEVVVVSTIAGAMEELG